MDFLRKIVKESLSLAENVQLADKLYFNTGKLSPEVKKYILHITGGDAWTKLIADIYYAEVTQWKKQGAWAVSALNEPGEPEEEPSPDGQHDVMNIDDWRRIKAMYLQLKSYNPNVFPIAGLNVNGVQDIWELIRTLKQRGSILEMMKKLPSVAVRNMKNDIRQVRNSEDLNVYRDELEHFLAYYSMLSNREPKFRKAIENKMFTANITLEDLLRFAEEKENMVGGKPFTKNSIKRLVSANSYDMDIVYEQGNVMVIDVTSPEAIKKIGCNSLWCFTYGTAYQQASTNWPRYSTNDHVYVIIDFSVPSDSVEFMHVLIKPLDFKGEANDDGSPNDHKLYDMANQESYDALGIINHLIGDQAPYILHFDEPVDTEGPNSKWPYEDPNQLKLDLQEFRKLIRQVLNESKDSRFMEKIQDLIASDGALSRYFKTVKIKDWPRVPSSEGYGDDSEGPLDLENNELVSLDDKKLTMVTGGDWQDPWVVDIGMKGGNKLSVLDYRPAEKGEYKKLSKNGMSSDEILDKIFEDSPMHDDVKSYFKVVAGHLSKFSPWDNSYGDEDYENELIEGPKINDNTDGVYVIWKIGGHDKSQKENEDYEKEYVEKRFIEWAEKRVWCGKKKEFKIGKEVYKVIPNLESLGNDLVKHEIKIQSKKINEAKSKFKKLKDNEVPLTPEERKKVMDADAVWNHGPNGEPSPAVWKSEDKDGKVTYVTNTHRAFQSRPTLKGAISIYHSFIKGTS